MSLRKRGSSWCRTGSADRLLRPIGRHPPPLLLLCTRADRKLIGQLLCLPDLRLAYWPVLVSPPRPQSPILSQYESMLQTSPSHQTHPPHFSSASSYSRHLASAALFTSARLGSPASRDLYNLHAHVHQIDFPTDTGISSSSVPHSGPLPPEPVPFPAVSSGAEQQSSSTRCKLHPSSGLLLCGSVAAILLLCVANSAESGSWKGTQPPPGALPYTRYPDNTLSIREATII